MINELSKKVYLTMTSTLGGGAYLKVSPFKKNKN